jgi:two-component system, NtrC family, response regulator AtoC
MVNNTNPAVHMLLISREPSALACLWALSEANAWKLDAANSGLHALEVLRSGATMNLVLLDLEAADVDGLRTLRWLRRVRPEVPVVLLCPRQNKGQMAEAVRLGAHDCVIKPCQAQQLEKVLKRHVNGNSQGEKGSPTSGEIEPIGDEMSFVAGTPVMRKLRARVELLAQINVPVLILGESGSGKEIVARLIHKLSVRSGNQFLKFNCGALPRELLECELFGYERGGAAGTPRASRGKLEVCDGGTILLNEITEMPSGLQSQLLHIVQDGRFFRVGGKATIPIDIRVLAATNMDLERALFEKKLREDLYYRLSAFTVHVPPLRQRKEEIPLLLGHFMNRMSKHYELPVRIFSPNVLEACQQYSWPGNLIELENFVKRYLVMGDESLVLTELEPGSTLVGQHSIAPGNDSGRGAVESAESLKSLVRSAKGETERNAISGALEQTHWNRKAAARLLRISYRALLYKIQQYQMSPPQGYLSQFATGHGTKGNGRAS